MTSSLLLLGAAVVLYSVFSYASGLRTNIVAARKTGLPYIVLPASPFSKLSQLSAMIWIPIVKLLPKRCWESWLFAMDTDWGFHYGQEPFNRLGDTFVGACPGRLVLWTRDADVIRQIVARRDDFPKPTEIYTILALFGQNVLTTEGQLWRIHRKATAPSFNEKNAAHTFAESVRQTSGMLTQWLAMSGETIRTTDHDTMVLALNIIRFVGFGMPSFWPGQALPEKPDPRIAKYGVAEPPPGHSMTFAQSVATVLDRIVALLFLPPWLLRLLPFKATKEAYEASTNYSGYMQELLTDKLEEVRKGDRGDEGMDLMGGLVRARYEDKKKTGTPSHQLSDSDIVGNAFIMLVAGHETTANVLHFTLLELANNPAAQRAVQADVDRLFGTADPATWNYEQNINAMLASHLGACMNETLRALPPVVEVHKKVSPAQEQVLAIAGTKCVLPASMNVCMSVVSVHRNPRYWPTRPSRLTGQPTDLNDYVPERWFRSPLSPSAPPTQDGGVEKNDADADAAEEEDYGGFHGPDTSAQLFRPPRGAFVPFSDGSRSCLGRRIAQVEIVAALAVIFQRYSVELAVDEWASDDDVARMAPAEKASVYGRAQAKSRATIAAAGSILTLKLQPGAYVPLRLVRRGDERFLGLVDQ